LRKSGIARRLAHRVSCGITSAAPRNAKKDPMSPTPSKRTAPEGKFNGGQKMATAAFPDSSNLYDTLGEIYMNAGDKPHAIAAYEQAIATCDSDPRYTPELKVERRRHAEEMLAKLRK